MRYHDMLIDTEYPLTDIETRTRHVGHEDENQCTYCLSNGDETWYPIAEIFVVRAWHRSSVYRPELTETEVGGHWEWRCRNHPRRNSSPWASLAPAHLRPPVHHRCEGKDLGRRCPDEAEGRYADQWLCLDHARPHVARLALEERLADIAHKHQLD